MKIEEIKERSKGITTYMHDANKAEIHRRDCLALLSIIEQGEKDNDKLKRVLIKSRIDCTIEELTFISWIKEEIKWKDLIQGEG